MIITRNTIIRATNNRLDNIKKSVFLHINYKM